MARGLKVLFTVSLKYEWGVFEYLPRKVAILLLATSSPIEYFNTLLKVTWFVSFRWSINFINDPDQVQFWK